MLGALTAGALTTAAMGSVLTAGATCASFFGIGSGGQCTSTLTSIAGLVIGNRVGLTTINLVGIGSTLSNSGTFNNRPQPEPGPLPPHRRRHPPQPTRTPPPAIAAPAPSGNQTH